MTTTLHGDMCAKKPDRGRDGSTACNATHGNLCDDTGRKIGDAGGRTMGHKERREHKSM